MYIKINKNNISCYGRGVYLFTFNTVLPNHNLYTVTQAQVTRQVELYIAFGYPEAHIFLEFMVISDSFCVRRSEP